MKYKHFKQALLFKVGSLSKELDNLTCFFNRNLDFYQYYRFHSTLYDEYYVVRGKFDLRLCTDSAQFDKDLNFSTCFFGWH